MIYRIYVEKKRELAQEAAGLLHELQSLLGISTLTDLRIFNRYDVDHLSEELFEAAVSSVFSEPPVDQVYRELELPGATLFAVEYLPGQFDQRADSAAQCIQILSCSDRPTVRSARVYALYGALSDKQLSAIKKHVINPVEAREASLEYPETLDAAYSVPEEVASLDSFAKYDRNELEQLRAAYGLAMDFDDLRFCQSYFQEQHRDPTLTELRMIDTYWSDHCRHTTFHTVLDEVHFEDPMIHTAYERYLSLRERLGDTKPICFMDLATITVRHLKKEGLLDRLDESDEINACTVKIDVTVDGVREPWLLLFKNETHNHPTEIEPFGGAATCIGGAIRDPLSGRAYVYGAMRLTGAADPRRALSETLPGKLPQRKIVTTAAAGYSSYGNQIGLATGIVDELYHDGYAAKRMEIGAVIAAAPADNVRRETPAPGDVVILLGGRTGRDGCGGATGSSKSHTVESLESCGAEVQKGNAPEERKLQRLFRNPQASRRIKRCNDFGAGGVSVAIGELADGLDIDLNAVPRKYDGLDGTELAISESQERMAVVVAPGEVDSFIALAEKENVEATPVAAVTEEPRLIMRWNGKKIVDIHRSFLNSNGAPKHVDVVVATPALKRRSLPRSFSEGLRALAQDLNCCSKRGLSERFDSTVGAGTVLMPFGGRYQRTPIQSMVHKISVESGDTPDCSFMSWGFNPLLSEQSPYHGAYLAVVESVCKLVASGASFESVYLSFQEYFERLEKEPERWGQPLAALLGAFEAQLDLGIAAIGGKDSMSGTFEALHVPPTLVSFAVTTGKTDQVLSPEFKAPGHLLYLVSPKKKDGVLPDSASLHALFRFVTTLQRNAAVVSSYTPGIGGVAEALLKMSFGNRIGAYLNPEQPLETLFDYRYGSFILEATGALSLTEEQASFFDLIPLGETTEEAALRFGSQTVPVEELLRLSEETLEEIYPTRVPVKSSPVQNISFHGLSSGKSRLPFARPRVLIPVFPGTNCEYESAKAVEAAGAQAQIFVVRNRDAASIQQSVDRFAKEADRTQMIFIPGGFSGGDEPDGSGKFITAFFRSAAVKESVTRLLEERDGLICGICNGFQALIKLGLLPYGHITEPEEDAPTLTFNTIARHQSKIVRTRVAANHSPWLSLTHVGDVFDVPVSHGEGRFLASDVWLERLKANGQIATQYVDLNGQATQDIQYNPNGSVLAIEGITSPDGRVFGKMGHSERIGKGLYQNVPGVYDLKMFEAAVRYFQS